MTEALVTICLDNCSPYVNMAYCTVSGFDYDCVQGVKFFHTYTACYQQGIECAVNQFIDYLGGLL
jgi:hypothetical protein